MSEAFISTTPERINAFLNVLGDNDRYQGDSPEQRRSDVIAGTLDLSVKENAQGAFAISSKCDQNPFTSFLEIYARNVDDYTLNELDRDMNALSKAFPHLICTQ